MAKNSKIEWTHHTFNPWWGCVKVSPACKNCYAEAWAKRVGRRVWGARASRRFFGESHWREPLRWNSHAEDSGERKRVFCASMADIFESRLELDEHRDRLWSLVEKTPWLDWLLLTKRPHNIARFSPWSEWPSSVWLGTTAETQKWADERIPALAKIRSSVRFVSVEPLLGSIDFGPWLKQGVLDWIIVGGESGPRARPTKPIWVRNIRDQCTTHGVAFHFKQWGHWSPYAAENRPKAKVLEVEAGPGHRERLFAVGKKHGGRELDGKLWNGVPNEP